MQGSVLIRWMPLVQRTTYTPNTPTHPPTHSPQLLIRIRASCIIQMGLEKPTQLLPHIPHFFLVPGLAAAENGWVGGWVERKRWVGYVGKRWMG